MSVYTCRRCGHEQDDPWEEVCPNCHGFYRPRKYGVDSADQKGGFATLGGKAAAGKYHYHSTGEPGLDKVMGGGLVAGKSVLLGGFAGTGKTRLLLTVADYIAKTKGRVIYASGEESEDDLNMTASQLGLTNDQVTVMGNQLMLEKVLDFAKKINAFLVIYDSAQKFMCSTSSGNPGSLAQCKGIGEAIKFYCGKTKTCAIIVNQMSKDGDLKGGTELEHHCDTVMVLAYAKPDDTDAPQGEDVRLLVNSKNRVGKENVKSYYKMNDEGRLELLPPRSALDLRAGKYRRGDEDDDAA